MKTIGLIGGMSWESSIEYYRIINQTVNERLGGVHSAKSLMYSFDFADIEALQREGDWDQLTQEMVNAAQTLEQGGADLLVICTNTMHRMADDVQAAVSIPLLHITDATAQAIQAQNIDTVGLLGTRFTMEGDFYRLRLEEKHGLGVLIPPETERETVHRIIYDELVKGIIRDSSRDAYLQIIEGLQEEGAQGIILGCTEIPLLVKPSDVVLPLFDTTTIHAQAAVDWSLTAGER
jgi:aspartate racemase